MVLRMVFLFLIIGACKQSSTAQQFVKVIDSEKLVELRDEGINVIDVRTKREFDNGHISGAINVDFLSDDFLSKMTHFDKTKPIIIHCAVGGRSGKAASDLIKEGFRQIYDYSGGISDWKKKGGKLE